MNTIIITDEDEPVQQVELGYRAFAHVDSQQAVVTRARVAVTVADYRRRQSERITAT